MTIVEFDLDVSLPPKSESRVSVHRHPNSVKFFRLLEEDASIDSLTKTLEISRIRKILRIVKARIRRILK